MRQQRGVSEEQLVQAAKRGDLAAFNRLVLMYQQQVYNIAYRLLGDPEAAADATQDAFLKAYERLHQHRGGSFRAWLLRIVTNTCYDQLRKQQRYPTQSLDNLYSDAADSTVESDRLPEWQSDAASPEEMALRHEVFRVIQEGLLSLSPEHRTIIVLSDIEGLSYEEIAVVLNIPIGTVKSRLSRARARLRDYLRTHHAELLPEAYRL